MKTTIFVIYEKLTSLELSILETMENELLDLREQLDYYEKGSNERELIGFQYEVTNELYFSILEDFVNHRKAIEEKEKEGK